jgi:Spy/CpxP family protein refolding chaperone
MTLMGKAILLVSFVMAGAIAAGADTPPHAGMDGRQIKALAPERMADLLAGRGAGYALAAELNGYPGPRHVLDFAEQLRLGPRQLAHVETLFYAMQDEAKVLGRALVEREAELDDMFATARATATALERTVSGIAEIESRLRATHLRYHLETRSILTPDQIAHYARLRGYASNMGRQTKPEGEHGGHH